MEPRNNPIGSLPTDDHGVIRYNAKLGLGLFILYLLVYAGFVGLCAFKHDTIVKPWLGDVNIAVWYGFGLIVGAFVLAVIYLLLCRK